MEQDVNQNVLAALEAAASESEESSTEDAETNDETTEEVSEETDDKPEKAKASEAKGKGAQDRIRELVGKSRGLEGDLDDLKGTVNERDTEIGKLVDLIEARENDSRIVQRINELHADPRYTDMIENLDKVVRGEDLVVETPSDDKTEEGETKVDDKALKVLEATQEALEDRVLDQQAEILLGKADLLADRYIDELPEEYNDDDKRLLRGHLTELMDWDSIEEDPDQLPHVFADGFQSALDHYGQPKGFVPESESDDTDGSVKSRTISDEELVEQDWGKMKAVTTPDGETLEPSVPDSDFQEVLAEVIRRGRR
jgi:hypothetical protein